SRFEGSYWNLWVSNVPAMGFKTFRIEVEDKPAAPQKEEHSDSLVLENPYYRIVADASSGTIASLYDKELDRELVEKEAPYGFGQFIYDRLADAHFFNRESFLARSTRSTLRDVKVVGQGASPLWESLLITGSADGCLNEEGQPGLECEVRLYRAEKKVEFQYRIRKKYISEPESVYIAFPFAFPDGKFFYEAQGGIVQPGVDQLPGSSADWHTVQNFVSVRDEETQAVLISDEIPMVQFGDINLGKWQYIAKVENPFLFSWVMNNYWTSGFPGVKESEFTWSYHLTSTENTSNSFASRFGWASRTPLTALVSPAGTQTNGDRLASTFEIENPNVLLVNATPTEDGSGIVCHLREVEGKRTEVDFKFRNGETHRIDEVSVLGNTLKENLDSLSLNPFEVKFVRVSTD
ncbi:MAG: hypothetical protein KC931_17175, partial [Candidatus Omnitrophica bacterium]|nr:hypothetical protein [Candidatus Omnitrophota bacterium]